MEKNNNEKMAKIFISLFLIICFVLLIVFIAGLFNNKKNSEIEADIINSNTNNEINKSIDSFSDIFGTYSVKSDKLSNLILREGGNYEFNFNTCEGYLKISGTYEIRDKKVILYNSNIDSKINTLNNNEEIIFTLLNDNFIRLDEDISCLYQGTLFER